MRFHKSNVFTALNADEIQPGSLVIGAYNMGDLEAQVAECESPQKDAYRLVEVLDKFSPNRFHLAMPSAQPDFYSLVYLVEPPKKLVWTDLKVGDVIKRTSDALGLETALVIRIIDKSKFHVMIGNTWIADDELEKWSKA